MHTINDVVNSVIDWKLNIHIHFIICRYAIHHIALSIQFARWPQSRCEHYKPIVNTRQFNAANMTTATLKGSGFTTMIQLTLITFSLDHIFSSECLALKREVAWRYTDCYLEDSVVIDVPKKRAHCFDNEFHITFHFSVTLLYGKTRMNNWN